MVDNHGTPADHPSGEVINNNLDTHTVGVAPKRVGI
jgi:hypothetical protein